MSTTTTTRTRNAFRMQLLPLFGGFLLLAIVVGTRIWLIEQQRDDNVEIRAAFNLERRLTNSLSLLQDAEIGQRGYVLTGNEAYLAPYEQALRMLPAQLEAVAQGLSDQEDRRRRFERLRTLITDKLAELDKLVALRREEDMVGAIALIQSDRGRVLMDQIREVMVSLREEGGEELDRRLARAERTGEALRVGSIAALAGVFVLGAFGIWDARRRMRAMLRWQGRLEQANVTLSAEIAQREKAEAQMRQMQKMEAVGQLTGGIAHDFNNMLAVMLSAMDLIRRKLSRGDTDVRRYVDQAADAANRAATLTARLLAFSRQQPLAPQVLDVNRLIAGMSDLLRRTLGDAVEIETVLAGGLWRTHADASQLENAVINLAVNARDAMDGRGRLTIETANCHLDDDYAAAHQDVAAGQYVMAAVTDTGAGMPPEVAAKAFDPFFTTKEAGKGTGLGLSQVFGFVRQSGGHVKIYSEPGQGTAVKIYLPRHFGEEEMREDRVHAVSPASAPTETILVVEDDERVRAMSVAALRELGYSVVEAAGGAEALGKLKADPEIALLFTDIVMPGMSGRQIAEEALKLRPDLKLIFTTGFTRNAVVHNGVLDHGVNFLAKPFSIDRLAAKMREVLDS